MPDPEALDRTTAHPFFPNTSLVRTNSGAILLTSKIQPLLPSPCDRRGILDFLGFDEPTVEVILESYDRGSIAGFRLQNHEARRYPLVSALVRTWEVCHGWEWPVFSDDEFGSGESATFGVRFAVLNGLREGFARDVDWTGVGGWAEKFVRYQINNVDLLKGLLIQDEQHRLERCLGK